MTLRITVHRATDQIGGNCIEICSSDGRRIVLDVGRPLDALKEAKGLLPKTLDLEYPVDGVLISHPHQDHYGLLDEIPPHWPVYSGRWAGQLMHLTASIFGAPPVLDYRHWESGKPIDIGVFRVTPLLTDHSAFDAYMLLIEAEGKRILYSGDFRSHGRKAVLVDRLMQSPPSDIDVLLMEGTNLGSNKPTASESDLEEDFVTLFKETLGRVFVCWSAQNIDRTVTLYRSCLKSGRTLAVDLYTAEVLDLLADAGQLPRAGWKNLKIVITKRFADLYRRKGQDGFVAKMAAHGISAAQLASDAGKWVIMIRPSLIHDLSNKGVTPNGEDAWCYSQWRGYLEQPEGIALKAWFDEGGSKAAHIHTSGHASVADLKAFAAEMNPRMLVPIHGIAWDSDNEGFANVVRLRDGEPMNI